MAWNSVTTEEFKNGNNSATEFSFGFPYLQEEDVKVEIGLNGVWTANTAFTFKTGDTIKFNSAPAAGTGNIRIFRESEINTAKAIYTAGSTVRAKDLNDNSDQYLYASQEVQSNLITSNDIRDGAIMNADLNEKAEVAVSKLEDGAARQVLQTASDGTTVEWTDSLDLPGSLDVTGNTTLDGDTEVKANLTVKADNKGFAVQNASGADKFTVDTDNGDTVIEGTATLKGTTNLNGTTNAAAINASGAVGVDGNFDVNTNKFTVAAATGNTTIAGTLTVTGDTTLAAGSIGTAELADNSVDGSKLSTDIVLDTGQTIWFGHSDNNATDNYDTDTFSIYATADETNNSHDAHLENWKGNLHISTSAGSVNINKAAGDWGEVSDETMAKFNVDGSAELYHNNVKKFETTSTGTSVTGNIAVSGTVDGRDLQTDGTKLDGIATGAEVNVQSDWNQSTTNADDFIKNKPTLVSGINDLSDVDTTGVANNKILKYVAADSKWKIADDGGSGSAITVLNDSTTLSTGATKLTFTGAGVTATEPSDDEITVTVPGTDTNTTYTTSFVDSSNDCILRLTDSGSGTDDLKFVAGSNITLTPSGDNLTIASSGGGGSALTVSNDGSDTGDDATTINFTGAGVTASGSGATKTITIPGGSGNTSTDFKYLELKDASNASNNPSYPAQNFTLVTAGTTTALTPAQANALIISYGGVIQQPNTGTSAPSTGFAIDGSTIKFGSAIAAAPDFIIYLQGAGVASIADNTVTGDKIALGSDAAGDIMYYNGTDYARLAKGTNGHYLKQGTSNAPEWAAVPAGVGGDTGVDFNDDVKVRFGTGNDLEIYYDPDTGGAARSIINHTGSGFLQIKHGGNNSCSFGDGSFQVNTASSGASGIEIQGSGGGYITFTPSSGTAPQIVNSGTGIQIKTSSVVRSEFTNDGLSVTGTCTATDQITGRGFECPETVSDDWTIAAGNNAMFPGPMTVAANKTVTVPANRTLTIV